MICLHCYFEIDDDSTFCDQCGNEVLVCPACGKTGTGKKCQNDGSKLVRNNGDMNFQQKKFFQTKRLEEVVKSELSLINKNLNLELKIENGDILGRKTGRFADKLSALKQISSKHLSCSFNKQTGWTVTDLNSTNGTKLNNIKLIPAKPYQLKRGDSLIIADVEFYISIKKQ